MAKFITVQDTGPSIPALPDTWLEAMTMFFAPALIEVLPFVIGIVILLGLTKRAVRKIKRRRRIAGGFGVINGGGTWPPNTRKPGKWHFGGQTQSKEKTVDKQAERELERMRKRAEAMHAIEQADFSTVPIMNRSENAQFRAMENALGDCGHGFRLMAQVSLAELVRPSAADPARQSAALRQILTRRVDFAVVDRAGRLAVAIEYQGHGHYQNGAFARDAIKREVIRKAGADWMEIEADASPADSVRELGDRLKRRCSPLRP